VESKKTVPMNLLTNRSKGTDVENKLTVTGGEGRRDKLGDWEYA